MFCPSLKGTLMIEFIITLGQFVVGMLVLGFIVLAIIALLIEIYDRVTGADEKKQQMKERLKSIEEDHT